MKILPILLALTLLPSAHAEQTNLSGPIFSENFGFGKGIVMQEIDRDPDRSLFRIYRKYAYQNSPNAAWGTPQNFFVMCALQKIGVERNATKIRMNFETTDNGQPRPMRGDETFFSIAPDQLYLRVEWLQGEIGDANKLLNESIIPFNDHLVKSCTGFRTRAGIRK